MPELVSATPGPGDIVEGSPAKLVATFNQDLDPSRGSLGGPRRVGLDRRPWRGARRRATRVPPRLPELAPGEYEVRWTSFSAEDGELARDSYAFTVVATPSPSPSPSPAPSVLPSPSPTPAVATPSPSPSASPSPDDTAASGDGVILLPILAASLIVGAIGVWLIRRRAT